MGIVTAFYTAFGLALITTGTVIHVRTCTDAVADLALTIHALGIMLVLTAAAVTLAATPTV